MNVVSHALTLKQSLLDSYLSTPGFNTLVTITEGWLFKVEEASGYHMLTDDERETAIAGARALIRTLVHSETYAVTDEIIDTLGQAAPLLPSHPLSRTDFPTASGFIFLETVIPIEDDLGKMVVVRAIAWQVYEQGVSFVLWTHPWDERDALYSTWCDAVQRTPDSELIAMASRIPMAMWGSMVTWDTNMASTAFPRLIATFLLFIQEPWIDNRMMVPNRQMQRKMERRGIVPKVRVVELRKAEHKTTRHKNEDEETIPFEWSHRWIVEGHWRNQWYPSLQEHRQRWIPRHLKGPEDKPLVLKTRTFAVRR